MYVVHERFGAKDTDFTDPLIEKYEELNMIQVCK